MMKYKEKHVFKLETKDIRGYGNKNYNQVFPKDGNDFKSMILDPVTYELKSKRFGIKKIMWNQDDADV